jgi:hypothetical protein
MKKFLERFEAHMMAVAFAEAGEYKTARQFITDGPRPSKQNRPRTESVRKQPRKRMQA